MAPLERLKILMQVQGNDMVYRCDACPLLAFCTAPRERSPLGPLPISRRSPRAMARDQMAGALNQITRPLPWLRVPSMPRCPNRDATS